MISPRSMYLAARGFIFHRERYFEATIDCMDCPDCDVSPDGTLCPEHVAKIDAACRGKEWDDVRE